MRHLRPLPVIATLAACVSFSAVAHHSRGNFNLEETVEMQGVITEYSWRNPHTFARIAVENEAGETEELLLELNSISVLSRAGWTRDTMQVGDEVTVFANPDFNPEKKLFYSNYFVLPDGSLIASSPGSAPDAVPQVAQRQVDPDARSEDFSGIWRAEGRFFGGGGMGMGMGGGNAPPANAGPQMSLGGQGPAVGLPLTAQAQAELDSWDVADNPWFRCEAKTAPWAYSGVGAHWIVLNSPDEILIRYEINDATRTIHMGMTEHPADTELTHQGHSIGWYENDALVIDTAYFAPAQWGIGSGVSSSDQKHLIERFTLIDDGRRLRLDYTITDPVALTEPVSLSQIFGIDPGYPWQDEYGCDPEASSRHLIEVE